MSTNHGYLFARCFMVIKILSGKELIIFILQNCVWAYKVEMDVKIGNVYNLVGQSFKFTISLKIIQGSLCSTGKKNVLTILSTPVFLKVGKSASIQVNSNLRVLSSRVRKYPSNAYTFMCKGKGATIVITPTKAK